MIINSPAIKTKRSGMLGNTENGAVVASKIPLPFYNIFSSYRHCHTHK